jgi:5-oxoprolinase (ATP-hydrolysing) subunit A
VSLSIDLNADLGEGCLHDERLLDLVTSASICCGSHAGGPEIARRTLAAAATRGVAVGAHPGYADREHFGRREHTMKCTHVISLIQRQVEELTEWASHEGITLRFVKPHGALYNQAQKEEEIARGVVQGVQKFGLPVLGQPGGVLERIANEAGMRFIAEGFPDRRYEPDGRLVPRSQPNAVLHDLAEIEDQVVRLVRQGLDTLCIHGDDPHAVANAQKVRDVLARHGLAARFWG